MTSNADTLQAIQSSIWDCEVCVGDKRVETRLRQQTRNFPARTRLLVVATAPPYRREVLRKMEAASVHSDPRDRLRAFLVKTIGLGWEDLLNDGLAVAHAVKCAIVPKDRDEDERQHQNPPQAITTKCARLHFAREFRELRAPVVITLGTAARLAVRRACGIDAPLALKLPLKAIAVSAVFPIDSKGMQFQLIASSHPFSDAERARGDLLRAATIAGLRRVAREG